MILPSSDSASLPLTFRVGITGARDLAPETLPRLRAQLDGVLRSVLTQLERIAASDTARKVYFAGAPRMLMLSPLATGADQLAAEAGLALGYRLIAPLPFPVDDYARDFGDDAGSFHALLDRADVVLALDGARGVDEGRSYQSVGQLVARKVDLLIAVWDGKEARGPGGTGDIVAFAAGTGVAVWWIHADDDAVPPVLIDGVAELRARQSVPNGAAALAALDRLVTLCVAPPMVAPAHRHGLLGRLVHRRGAAQDDDSNPIGMFYAERLKTRRWIWSLYGGLFGMIAPRAPVPQRSMLAAEGPQETWWDRIHVQADRPSLAYGDRYRSSYVAIFAMAAIALVCPAVERLLPHSFAAPITVLELAMLVGIALLVGVHHRFSWHERWDSYRLPAQLCRKQQLLTPLARVLPVSHAETGIEQGGTRGVWVAW